MGVRGIDISKLLGTSVKLVPRSDKLDPVTRTYEKAEPTYVMTYSYGERVYSRESDSYAEMDLRAYVVDSTTRIEEGDELDGRIVKTIEDLVVPKNRIRKTELKFKVVHTIAKSLPTNRSR